MLGKLHYEFSFVSAVLVCLCLCVCTLCVSCVCRCTKPEEWPAAVFQPSPIRCPCFLARLNRVLLLLTGTTGEVSYLPVSPPTDVLPCLLCCHGNPSVAICLSVLCCVMRRPPLICGRWVRIAVTPARITATALTLRSLTQEIARCVRKLYCVSHDTKPSPLGIAVLRQ